MQNPNSDSSSFSVSGDHSSSPSNRGDELISDDQHRKGKSEGTSSDDDVPFRRPPQQSDKSCEIDGFSGYPAHVADLIVSKLNARELVRFSSVSTSWRVVARTVVSNPESRIPWLLVDQTGASSCLFNLLDRRVYEIQMPKSDCKGVVGSCDGWFMTLRFLYNPFSGMKRRLKFAELKNGILSEVPPYSWSRSYFKDFVVVGCESRGNETLVSVNGGETPVVFEGCIYALYNWNCILVHDLHKHARQIFDLGSSFFREGEDHKFSGSGEDEKFFWSREDQKFLVKSGKNLFLVGYGLSHREDADPAIRVKVYKLVSAGGGIEPKWIRVGSLGDQAFFVSNFGCFSLPAVDYLQCVRRNSIYFSLNSSLYCTRVYCLEDGSVEELLPSDVLNDHRSFRNPIWISSKFPFW